jgi:hypothetical protein
MLPSYVPTCNEHSRNEKPSSYFEYFEHISFHGKLHFEQLSRQILMISSAFVNFTLVGFSLHLHHQFPDVTIFNGPKQQTHFMSVKILSDAQISSFQRDGFVLISTLFDQEETDILRKTAKTDAAMKNHAYDLKDGEGGATKLVLWNNVGEDVYGTVARCPRIVHAMEQLLGDEVYHYHSKMSIKEPFTGGAWSWHQD